MMDEVSMDLTGVKMPRVVDGARVHLGPVIPESLYLIVEFRIWLISPHVPPWASFNISQAS